MEDKNIRAMMVIEMIGRPKKHVLETMESLIKKLEGEKGIELINKNIHEPKKIEGEKEELFSCFCEIEIDISDIANLSRIIFTYAPSHVEIIKPEELKMKNFELSEIMSAIIQKLHSSDAIVKALSIEKRILENKLKEYEEKSGVSVSDSRVFEIGGDEKKSKP